MPIHGGPAQQGPPDFWVETAAAAGVHRVTVGGEVDYLTADRLSRALEAIPADAAIVVDLADVTLLDSSGLQALVSAYLRARHGRGSLEIVNEQPAVRRVFEITGVARLLGVSRR